jgi:uncharacterized protein YdhG (YjbR/CyaY superfamily)
MPTFKYQGKSLVGFAAFKDHCSLFPYSKKVMDAHRDELESYDTSRNGATIRFQADKPLPDALVKRLVKTRMEEIETRARR